jgi:hypothetical protein
MTQLSVSDGKLNIEVKGWDRLWALRSHLSIPLEDVVRVYADSQIAEPWWKGLRVAGTNLPGVLAAGTFYHHSQWVFWDVHNPEKVVVIELRHEHYAKLIVEVEDPAATVAAIQRELNLGVSPNTPLTRA